MNNGRAAFAVRPFSQLVLVLIVVLVLVLAVGLAVVLVLVAVLVVVLILISVLVIHICDPPVFPAVLPLDIDCPKYQLLSFALKIKLARRPAVIAAAMPPAVAFSPPDSTPIKPSSLTASRTPFAKL